MRRGIIHGKASAAGYALVVGTILILSVKGCGRFLEWRLEREIIERLVAE